MNKQRLLRFINKYHLNGNVESVILRSKNDTLSARFITQYKSLLGEIKMKDWEFEESELGIFNTTQLVKLLGVVDAEIDIKLTRSNDTAISLEFSDEYSKINYMLSDLSIIQDAPPLKSIPEFQVTMDIDAKFISTFIAGKAALSDVESFTVMAKDNNVDVVIGYSQINSNRVTIPTTVSEYSDMENVSFNANLFKEVLSANKECKSATLEVSDQGLARAIFNVDDFSVVYYLVAMANV